MVEELEEPEQPELPVGAGEMLRAARVAKGMSLAQVAEQTRITQRHLAQIEAGELGSLPGRTYALGFSRNFAKVVGLDEKAIAKQVREELALIDPDREGLAVRTFEPGDPARVPSAGLAWFSAFAALVLFLGGSFFVWNSYIAPSGSLPWLTADREAVEQAPVQPKGGTASEAMPPDSSGPVVFTALEEGIWVKFYDKYGRQLMQKQMEQGERYVVPADATDPQLWTGRPDALAISIGGRSVPKLAQSETVMKDVPVTAAALLAREGEAPEPVSPTG
jgi:transcriptional regulator with XRE-family HTH domain